MARRRQDSLASRRQAIARLMSRSVQEIPHYYVATRIPLGAAMTWLGAQRQLVARRAPAPGGPAAQGRGRRRDPVPELNGEWHDEAFHPSAGVDLGVAVAMRDGGLLTPTIHDAHKMDLAAVMRALRDLVARARRGRLRPSELGGASITVTNLGDRGAESVFGVIVPPQVALVGFGSIHDEPWVEDGLVGRASRSSTRAWPPTTARPTAASSARFLDIVNDAATPGGSRT